MGDEVDEQPDRRGAWLGHRQTAHPEGQRRCDASAERLQKDAAPQSEIALFVFVIHETHLVVSIRARKEAPWMIVSKKESLVCKYLTNAARRNPLGAT
ncbi:hypothetical protein WMF04_32320 [Sorangium sp. So ce260]|uniref:hypothetical protein n=1 Tax=Sorangium sp. So ce260 TaxID=3133291 RepID=UPI003F61E3F3